MENIERLRNKIEGIIITILSPEYSEARLNWDPYTSQFPSYIVNVLSEKDIKECIYWCKRYSIPFRIRGKVSHSLGYDFSSADGALVCNIQNFNKIVPAEKNTIIVGAGNVVGPIIYQLAKDGYMFPYGDVFTVGIGGILQGGGIGMQNKQMGLVCDQLLSCKLITASEHLITLDEKTNSDLFWAVRGGGGGNFGVITEMTLQYQEAPKLITYIVMSWRGIDLQTVRQIIVEWMETNLYENINICRKLEITKVSADSDLSNIDIYTLIYNNDESLFKFRPIGKYVKTVSILTYYEMVQRELGPSEAEIHADLNYKFLGYFSDKILDEETLDIIIDYFGKTDADLFFLELGGNFRKGESAFAWRNAKIYFELSRIWPIYADQDIIYNSRGLHESTASDAEAKLHEPNLDSYREAADKLGKKYKSGYVNVPNDTYTDPHQYEKFYYGENRYRLRRIKAKYDRKNFFNFSQSIKPDRYKTIKI